MHKLQETFGEILLAGLKRKSVTTPSRWAEKYRVMGPPYPGLWKFEKYPWLREMHDAQSLYCIGQKAAQMGYTETVLNITFYKIDIEGKSCLYVLPTKTPGASNFSSSRFDTALEASDHLKNIFSNVKNVNHKRAGTANLFVRGCRSRADLKSDPVAFVVYDELDEMNQDMVTLGEERVSGQPSWQIWKISTPTIHNKGINKEYILSTQEHFIFKCPHCGKSIELLYPDSLVITAESRSDVNIKNSHLICTECKGILDHNTKGDYLSGGIWQPFNRNEDKRGFYINQLYSFSVKPWQLADKFFAAQTDLAEEQEFYNSKLGLPHVAEGAQVNDSEIDKAIERSNRVKEDPIPTDKIITMGIDQGKWLHYVITAWEFPKFGNDLNASAHCHVLTEGKCVDFEELSVLMKQYQVLYCVIDAQPERRMAYNFACEFWGHVKLCFYSIRSKGKLIQIDSSADSHTVSVDRTAWLDLALNRFHVNTITLPKNTSDEYRSHIKDLVRRYDKDATGNPVGTYVNQSGKDHFAHAQCYAEIALPCAASFSTNQNIGSFL